MAATTDFNSGTQRQTVSLDGADVSIEVLTRDYVRPPLLENAVAVTKGDAARQWPYNWDLLGCGNCLTRASNTVSKLWNQYSSEVRKVEENPHLALLGVDKAPRNSRGDCAALGKRVYEALNVDAESTANDVNRYIAFAKHTASYPPTQATYVEAGRRYHGYYLKEATYIETDGTIHVITNRQIADDVDRTERVVFTIRNTQLTVAKGVITNDVSRMSRTLKFEEAFRRDQKVEKARVAFTLPSGDSAIAIYPMSLSHQVAMEHVGDTNTSTQRAVTNQTRAVFKSVLTGVASAAHYVHEAGLVLGQLNVNWVVLPGRTPSVEGRVNLWNAERADFVLERSKAICKGVMDQMGSEAVVAAFQTRGLALDFEGPYIGKARGNVVVATDEGRLVSRYTRVVESILEGQMALALRADMFTVRKLHVTAASDMYLLGLLANSIVSHLGGADCSKSVASYVSHIDHSATPVRLRQVAGARESEEDMPSSPLSVDVADVAAEREVEALERIAKGLLTQRGMLRLTAERAAEAFEGWLS